MMGTEKEPSQDTQMQKGKDLGSCGESECCGGGDCEKSSPMKAAPKESSACCSAGACETETSASAPKLLSSDSDMVQQQNRSADDAQEASTLAAAALAGDDEDYSDMPRLELKPKSTKGEGHSKHQPPVDDEIEEIPRPDLAPLPPRTSQWRLHDDGLRQRNTGGGCCSSGGGCGPRTYADETEEDVKDSKRRAWISFFLLLLMVIPAIPLVLVGWDFFINSDTAITMGLAMTPQQRLEAFYREHNPYKLNEYTIKTTLRKWEGRYDQMFKALDKKYSKKKRRSAKA